MGTRLIWPAFLAAIGGCVAADGPLAADRSGGVVAALESPDAGVDVPADAPAGCGSLCVPGDRLTVELQAMSCRHADESVPLDFSAAAGVALVEVTVRGNFGTIGSSDGAVVSVGPAAPCPSRQRQGGDGGGYAGCYGVVHLSAGANHVELTLHQWNGDDEAWTVTSGTATVTLE